MEPGAASCGRVAPLMARQTGHRVRALHGHGHERRGGDERDETGEEGLVGVDGVVALGKRTVDVEQLEADDAQAALLVALDDAPDQLALDAIGLDEDEGALAHVCSFCVDPCGVGPVERAWWARR